MNGADIRRRARAGFLRTPTAGLAPGQVQANMVALPSVYAPAFEAFCRANAQACPLIEVTEPGAHEPACAPGADLRTDLPRYHVYRDGELVGDPTDVRDVWAEDTVTFLVGCSFTFEHALAASGISLRHIVEGRNVAMYRTSIECRPVAPFRGPVVVSMRPLERSQVELAQSICARLPHAHGAPLAVGHPARLGIADLARPDYGDPVDIAADEVPVFWACGVSGIEAMRSAALPLAITHAPGHMFVTDRLVRP